MGKPKAPRPADPKVTAGAQTATNIGTAIAQQYLNNVDQETPYGSLTYERTGSHVYTDPGTGQRHEIPTFTARQTLSPGQQAILDQNERAGRNLARLGADQSARLGELLNRPMDMDDAGPVKRTYGTDFSKDRQRVEDALMARMEPSLERDRERLEARLASQGVRMGSEAYEAAMDDFSRQTNDARLGAILQGGREQSRLAGLEAQRAGFENAAQAQALQERLALRDQPLNEIAALLSGAQVRTPSFVTPRTARIPTTDYAGLQTGYDEAMRENYWRRMAAGGGALTGLLGAGANFFSHMPSDRRLKRDVRKVGKTFDGQSVYQFRHKAGGPIQMGLMAQEVEKKKPEAVANVGGIKMVDYGEALRGARS